MASRSKASKTTKSSKVSPIPPGMHSITPLIVIDGAAAAMDFYKKALGAQELSRSPAPNGKLLMAMMKIGDSVVMMCDEFPGATARSPTRLGASTFAMHVYTKDVDKMWQQAVLAGMKVIAPLEDMFWGERYGQLMDPFGHLWSLSMRIDMTPEEKQKKEREAMAMISQREQR